MEAAVANAFEMGPRAALTGPVVRGDAATVSAQLDAVAAATPEWLEGFSAQVALLARIAGRGEEFVDVLAAPDPRVTQADVPIPYNNHLEKPAKSDVPKTVSAVKRVLYLE